MKKQIFHTVDMMKAGIKESELLVKGYKSIEEAMETHNLLPFEYLKFVHESGTTATYELIWLE